MVKVPTEIAPDGQAWVSGEYVSAENVEGLPVIPSPELPPDVIIPTPNPDEPSATALDVLNIRSGPDTTYPSYGYAKKGAQGEVIGTSEDGAWWVVKNPADTYGIEQGWVSTDWVLFKKPKEVEIPVIPAP